MSLYEFIDRYRPNLAFSVQPRATPINKFLHLKMESIFKTRFISIVSNPIMIVVVIVVVVSKTLGPKNVCQKKSRSKNV